MVLISLLRRYFFKRVAQTVIAKTGIRPRAPQGKRLEGLTWGEMEGKNLKLVWSLRIVHPLGLEGLTTAHLTPPKKIKNVS